MASVKKNETKRDVVYKHVDASAGLPKPLKPSDGPKKKETKKK